MAGDVTFAGRRVRITIGALEEMSDGQFAPAVVLNALATNLYTVRELVSALSAGLKAAGESAEDLPALIDGAGIQAARDAALEALRLAFEGASAGNGDAAARKEAPTPAS